MKDNNVYIHKDSIGRIYYVGRGKKYRPFQLSKKARNDEWWKYSQKHGCNPQIILDNLTLEEAKDYEGLLIQKIGKENLTNKTGTVSEIIGSVTPYFIYDESLTLIDIKFSRRDTIDFITGTRYLWTKDYKNILKYML